MSMINKPELNHPGVIAPDELARRLPQLRAGKKVVFTNGCFDLLHPGHADLLDRARALGDMLVTGLNTDDSVRRLNKGPDRPVNPLEHRAFVLAHLESVDYVTWFEEDTPHALISLLVPDVLVKGGDWAMERIVGREVVQKNGGEVHSLPLLPGFSTTELLRRIRSW